jgi:hypothetical protein
MTRYEIRLRKASGENVISEYTLFSDFGAIRRAQSIAKDEDVVEVWRGLNCIYRHHTSKNGMAA